MVTEKQHKAVALISGGLDSMLAARVMQEQGIHVEGINFFTGFCVEGHTHAIRNKDKSRIKRNNALWVAEQLNIRLHMVDVIDEYKKVVLNPKYGYGTNLNPCLDCKCFMVTKALAWIKENGFDFIVTGEVVGQRPKSQRADTMPVVARESGAYDLLLRPLCAKNLPPTLPECKGWVNRDELYGFNGRSRKPQMALAAHFGIEGYAQPAGGCCFLTDANYSAKLNDLWRARHTRDYDLDDIMLLKVGRHLRPRPHFKLIIARDEGENNYLEGYAKEFTHLRTISHRGPLALIDGDPGEEDLILASQLVARFSQGRGALQVRVRVVRPSGVTRILEITPLPSEAIPREWYV
ncbi:MAG: tRNA (5-methylaminomethyl-2-thiouridylate)-methyltransferase [Candidatus Nitrosoglobus sp.]